MKKFIFIFFVFILLNIFAIGFISAISFSPSYLVFNLSKGQEGCQKITLSSESKTITVLDKWANESYKEWNPNLFNSSAELYELRLSYPEKISSDAKEVEICLSGEKAGEYHGIILLREEQKGNSVVQMGVWIKAVISNDIFEADDKNSGRAGITGAVIGALEGSWTIIILVIGIIFIAGMIIFIKNKKRDEWKI